LLLAAAGCCWLLWLDAGTSIIVEWRRLRRRRESPKQRRAKKLASDIYGFSATEPGSDKVLVWSVHTVVHAYPTFAVWLESMKH